MRLRKHRHELRPVAVNHPPPGLAAGYLGRTIILFACDCRTGPCAFCSASIVGRWELGHLTGTEPLPAEAPA